MAHSPEEVHQQEIQVYNTTLEIIEQYIYLGQFIQVIMESIPKFDHIQINNVVQPQEKSGLTYGYETWTLK